MAEPGDRFEMVDGSVYIVRRPAAETKGEYVEMEFVLPAGSFAPPPHVHPGQVEEYEVIEGRFDVMVNGEWSSLGPGESASVPVGALHTFKNRIKETIRSRTGTARRRVSRTSSRAPQEPWKPPVLRVSESRAADDHGDAVPEVPGHPGPGAEAGAHPDGRDGGDREAAAERALASYRSNRYCLPCKAPLLVQSDYSRSIS